MRKLLALCALAAAIIITSTSWAIEGGVMDITSRSVWSPSQTCLNGSTQIWKDSVFFASNYVSWDVNAAGAIAPYSDWRLPTLAELSAAINSGTIQSINYLNGFKAPAGTTMTKYFWTADSQTGKGVAMGLTFNDQGTIVGAASKLVAKSTSICGGFMVRP